VIASATPKETVPVSITYVDHRPPVPAHAKLSPLVNSTDNGGDEETIDGSAPEPLDTPDASIESLPPAPTDSDELIDSVSPRTTDDVTAGPRRTRVHHYRKPHLKPTVTSGQRAASDSSSSTHMNGWVVFGVVAVAVLISLLLVRQIIISLSLFFLFPSVASLHRPLSHSFLCFRSDCFSSQLFTNTALRRTPK
jgi:hypothetical protein